jgi:maltose alpha-D-glucosyltransferase/alpha-amylase
VLEKVGSYRDAAALLGRRTAELHLALATPTQDAAFTAEPTTGNDLAEDRERIDRQATSAMNSLQAALQSASGAMSTEAVTLANAVLLEKDKLFARIHLLNGESGAFGSRIRIHGDYHLGQLLRTDEDFLVVDFEGEPARSLEERRSKQSPLRDVAGMLRSFGYAAQSALRDFLTEHPENAEALQAWARAWEDAAGSAFLAAYHQTIAARPDLLPGSEEADVILQALLLEKAFYELLYELNNRPAWLPIPLNGLLAIARSAS